MIRSNDRYQDFTDYMVKFLQDNRQYEQMIRTISKDRRTHVEFVADLYEIWLKNPDKIAWYLEHRRLQIEM